MGLSLAPKGSSPSAFAVAINGPAHMISEAEVSKIASRVRADGYCFITQLNPDADTQGIAKSLGSVVDIPSLLPNADIESLQTITPKLSSQAQRNSYSSEFGLGIFPLHTDLSHWARPPRYFVLRAIAGAPDVQTILLPATALISVFGTTTLARALVRPRHARSSGELVALPLLFEVDGKQGLRWDNTFVTPLNAAATQVAEFMALARWDCSLEISVTFIAPGDTLIVDNWRFLHGRSAVPPGSTNRRLERVYLLELTT